MNLMPTETTAAPQALGQSSRSRRGIPLFEDESFDVPAFMRAKHTD
jgi:hypothetical protein